ncbi:MAG TPA: tetratricopeptide repeat protein, partial [Candidatus Marinimicrobia bacterium]|nr:tetratricopeptide repeat protein [Candidatus Neomarinimicrobiota bacterium]
QAFANAISVNPASSEWLGDALNTAGEYYRDNGMYRESLRAYQDAMELSPQKVNYYNGLGATYWYMGEKEMAVAAWEKSLSLKSDDNAARGWLLLADR